MIGVISFIMQNNLDYLLQPGSIIYTRCLYNDEWVPNTIKEVGYSLVKINLNDYYFGKGVMVGDFISLRLSLSDNEYILEGEISDIDIYDTYTISIFINNINIYKNRRKHFRYFAKLGSSIKTDPTEKGTYSIVVNLSLSGIALISKANISLNKTVFLDLFLSSKNIIPLSGVIIRKKALNYGYEYGIVITDIEETMKNKIKKLIDKLESNASYINPL